MKNKYYIFKYNLKILNVGSILLLFFLLLLTFFIDKNLLIDTYIYLKQINMCGIFLILYILYTFLHEMFHYIAYRIYGASASKLSVGSALEKGVLYCLCKQDISRKNILNSLMFPFFYLGIVPYIISIIFNFKILLFLAIFNIAGCIGDLIMFLYIVKLPKNILFTEFDDPISFAIKSETDITLKKHYGLEFEKTTDALARTINKKIDISKKSKIIFTVLMIIFLILLFLS